MKRVLILGAAGRDFHNFNVVFRNNPEFHVVAFTATQIPDITGRHYPPQLAGGGYLFGIPILEENKMEEIIRDEQVDVVVFSYSDVAHATVMHLASRAVAAGADFWLLGAARTQLLSKVPVISVCAVRTGCGKSPVSRRIASDLRHLGWSPVVVRHPCRMAIWWRNGRSGSRRLPTSTGMSAPSRSARSMSRTSWKAPPSTPEWITKRSFARRSRRATSSSGTAATMTLRSTNPTWTSWCSIRIVRDTSSAITRERSTSGRHMSSSLTKWIPPIRTRSRLCDRTSQHTTRPRR